MDFESNSEIVVDWDLTYLYVSLNDTTPVQPGHNGHKLSDGSDCFAMEFDRVLPVEEVCIRKKLITVHTVKLPLAKFKKAKFVRRNYSRVQIRWNDYDQDALLPTWVNTHDQDVFTVWQIIPTINCIPYLKLQQECLTQNLNS